jgi:glyoxylase-like metal-dependent hydrolase (beta-lactamase superfamily II)
VDRADVDFVILTHIHLDHAGGAGALLAALPRAVAVVHPRGAPHLADPARLEAGARAVYGEPAYEALYGPLVPIPAARVRAVTQGEELVLGPSRLRVLETPGHARHHIALHDEQAGAIFSGDAFGVSYRVFDSPTGDPFLYPATTPTQFDPGASHASIERIRARAPGAVYLTHGSRVMDVDRLAAGLHDDLDRFVAIAEGEDGGGDAEARIGRALHAHLVARLAAHGAWIDPGTRDDWLGMDVRLNAAGLVGWRGRASRERPARGPGAEGRSIGRIEDPG